VQFLHHFRSTFGRVDVIVNNAAQTVRRPPAYYRDLVDEELRLLEARGSGSGSGSGSAGGGSATAVQAAPSSSLLSNSLMGSLAPLLVPTSSASFDAPAWATLATQLAVLPSDQVDSSSPFAVQEMNALFPRGARDADDQPLDLRASTTWSERVGDVSYLEQIETSLVNVTAPFAILSELAPLLRNRANAQDRTFVVNVTSPEGQFATPFEKRGFHPHTNMAKSALNQLTRTIADDFARFNCFVTSVDTGWVSDMRPLGAGLRAITAPLTAEDGAARVLHPVVVGLSDRANLPPFGVLLRNFETDAW
jgi:NAD(P)-dependent dehydrogenase (short-subunit alcohol dehydrogenase family)